jgi:hypothetical protein
MGRLPTANSPVLGDEFAWQTSWRFGWLFCDWRMKSIAPSMFPNAL